MEHKNTIHYRHHNHMIGDVHPIYDQKTNQWLLYYLKPGGRFESSLSKSQDLLSYTSVPLTFDGTPRANYYVVAVFPYQDQYYSWFGQQYTHVCSFSNDQHSWTSATKYDVIVNQSVSKYGERDPYVVYDEEISLFYLVALAYLNSPTDCAIVFKKTESLDNWEEETKIIRRFPNGLTWSNGEPECPQLMKIGRRWYLFASLARKTIHHVGPLSYWIGDIDLSPCEVDWESKPTHLLTSEDLCAAQLANKGSQYYLFGWIPQQSQGNEWGGHLNFPLLVDIDENGELYTHFDQNFIDKVKGECVLELANKKIDKIIISSSFYLEIKIEPSNITVIEFNLEEDSIRLIIDKDTGFAQITMSRLNIHCSSIKLSRSIFDSLLDIKIIGETDLIEVNINNQFTLHARLNREFKNDVLLISDCIIHQLNLFNIDI